MWGAAVDNVSADEKHVLYGVRVIVERQEIDNVWQPHRWVIHDLVPLNRVAGDGTPPINDIPLTPLRAGDEGLSMLFTADASLDLHHAEAEAYAENLASSDPAIYLVLRKNENSDDYEDVEDVSPAGATGSRQPPAKKSFRASMGFASQGNKPV